MKKIISYLLLVFVSACIVSILLIFWILFIKLRNCWELTFDQKLSLLLDENTSFSILNQYCTEKNTEKETIKEYDKLQETFSTYSWCSLLSKYDSQMDFTVYFDEIIKNLWVTRTNDDIADYKVASKKLKEFCIDEQLRIEEAKLLFFQNIKLYSSIEQKEKNLLMLKKLTDFEKENWTLIEPYNNALLKLYDNDNKETSEKTDEAIIGINDEENDELP